MTHDTLTVPLMTNKKSLSIGPRDLELLTHIDQHPFTADQLLSISQTFSQPFTHERLVRRRLSQLRSGGLLNSFPYAVASAGGSPHYWKLSREGWRLIHGEQTILPRRRYFEAMGLGHHFHTYSLAQFLMHLTVQAHEEGISVRHFTREGGLKLISGPFTLFPDCAFELVDQDGKSFHFVVEVDNGTERIRTKLDTESIERKLRGYDAHQAQFDAIDPERYLVLFVTTRSAVRTQHILDLAATLMRNPNRTVFLGIELQKFLKSNPFKDAIFKDNRGLSRMMLPGMKCDIAATSTPVKK